MPAPCRRSTVPDKGPADVASSHPEGLRFTWPRGNTVLTSPHDEEAGLRTRGGSRCARLRATNGLSGFSSCARSAGHGAARQIVTIHEHQVVQSAPTPEQILEGFADDAFARFTPSLLKAVQVGKEPVDSALARVLRELPFRRVSTRALHRHAHG